MKRTLIESIKAFEADAAQILGKSDGAIVSRAFNVHESLVKVNALSLTQADLLKQAVRCIEVEVYRAAVVMAWAAVADLVLEVAVENSERILKSRNWNFSDKASLAESQAEYNIIEALHAVGVFRKNQKKTLQAMLHERNECAHPSMYFPGPNEALGFLDKAIFQSTSLAKIKASS